MTAIPEPQNNIQALIDAHHESKREKPRAHLGPSSLGHPCDRWLWLNFRWAIREKFPGRVLRLFRRGKAEEDWIISDLRAIGMDVRGTSGHQSRVEFGAHMSGSIDAIIEHGVPEAKKTRHVAEFKTHSKKSFDALVKDGLPKAKPDHMAQMQLYMHGMKITRALYVAVCKDDDRIYTERVRYDKAVAEKYLVRGKRITLGERLPEPLSTDETWYQCRFCAGHSFCFDTHLTTEVNCRTCAHVTPLMNSTWHCARYDAGEIPTSYQMDGCDSHVLHPDLVPWKRLESSNPWEAVYVIDGEPVRNGEGDAFTFSSKEILRNPAACTNKTVREVKETFNGEVIG